MAPMGTTIKNEVQAMVNHALEEYSY